MDLTGQPAGLVPALAGNQRPPLVIAIPLRVSVPPLMVDLEPPTGRHRKPDGVPYRARHARRIHPDGGRHRRPEPPAFTLSGLNRTLTANAG